MSDYTITTDFSVKDALAVDDPEKLILGSDLDVEFDAIQVAIATKYDSTDIATQAQAEAGTSNEVLMTPLRTAQYLAQGGSGAGIVTDLVALTDPGADRILFWDDSENTTDFLAVSTGLSISGTNLTTDDANIDHDALTNFVANEHIDHTGVTLTAGVGLTGGGTIAASRTFDLDIDGLTEELTFDQDNDYVAFYDDSASTHRKAPLSSFVGTALGDGKWYRNATQAVSSSASTLVFNTAEYDALEKGTFSTSTGEYTVGSASTRIYICATVSIATIDDDESILVEIQVNGTTKLESYMYNDTDNDSPRQSIVVAGNLTLAASDVVRVRVTTSSSESTEAGTEKTNVNIIELG